MRIFAIKIFFCLAGFYLLGAVSGNPYALAALAACAVLSYVLAYFLNARPEAKYGYLIGRCVVPVALLSIVLLNMTGLIGTLTCLLYTSDAADE